jgi:hypothetical protein
MRRPVRFRNRFRHALQYPVEVVHGLP